MAFRLIGEPELFAERDRRRVILNPAAVLAEADPPSCSNSRLPHRVAALAMALCAARPLVSGRVGSLVARNACR